MTAELYWFPWFVKDWLSSPARMAMLPEQRGAYLDLLCIAWGNGELEPYLPADDATLAQLSGLGARWKKLGALVRAQFFTDPDGVLRNRKLSSVWIEQHLKHGRAVARASAGGKAKAEKKRATSSAISTPEVMPTDCLHGADTESEKETTSKAVPAGWPGRLAAVWSESVGPVKPGRVGATLKPLVDSHGEERVERAMRAYIAVQKSNGKPCNVKWFADNGQMWLDRTKEPPGVVDGEMNETLRLLSA